MWLLLLLPVSGLILPVSAVGQEDLTKETLGVGETVEAKVAVIHQKIKAVGEKISAARDMESQEVANRFATGLDDLILRTTRLREVEIIYQRQLGALAKKETLQKELALLEESGRQGKVKTLPQKPPYSLNVYDYYLDQLANSTRQVEVATQAIAVGNKALLDANQRLAEVEKKIRALAELIGKGRNSGEWQKLLADDGKDFALALIDLQLLNGDNHVLELKLAELKQNIDQQNIDWLKENLSFSAEELAGHLMKITERRKVLEERIDKLLSEQDVAENEWLARQRQTDQLQPANGKRLAREAAYLQAHEAWRETYQQVISHNSSMLQLLTRETQLWQRRYAFLRGETTVGSQKKWLNEARAEIDTLGRVMALQQAHQNNIQTRMVAIRLQLGKEKIDPEVSRYLEATLQALARLAERNFEYLTVLQGIVELDQRLVAAIDEHLHEFDFGERLAMLLTTSDAIWHYELFALDSHGVTIGKICIALLILVVGSMLAGFFTRLLHRRMLMRLKMSVSTTAITEKLIYYSSLLVVIFIAMRSINLPMTAFAFLGGAVAIGVGFGAQKLVNNFISGFILMVEQPIRVGDLVQMDTYLGKVEDIGVRSTRVLTFDNVHLLVPNSYFLENNIINWTHNDNMVRAKVTVGVVYGSSTKLVKKQLLEAALAHGEVMKQPEPYVLFEDFGDNSLVFNLYFWIMVERVADKKRIESDIRFLIDKLFQDEQLVIAFPQRDVHLDTSRPLQISIIREDAEAGREGKNNIA